MEEGSMVSPEQRASLLTSITMEEVNDVEFHIDNEKAPVPDDFGALFFKRSWHTIGVLWGS
ncbi:hypothetical protein F511_26126 [Dorcoceras hygrometricum]|uniref:Uncharacterized protein n=1 Tax=Dorcoceras hygrometricum TaxID=472368 RepID=A0A2Z7CPH4_9LAMI|nr:hypothetical protein F511_26126 [Dorcoceras hygrometricum]